jgi:para-nitrobenzyl esterase
VLLGRPGGGRTMVKRGEILSLAVIILFSVARPAVTQIRRAKTVGGEVEGTVSENIASFKGIPFAAPPVGNLRWKAPQPVIAWSGVKKVQAYAPGCMQDSGMARIMGSVAKVSEDCLYLNVWTKARTRDAKLPVMVWIYGGAFNAGTTGIPIYDGTKLAKGNVIPVTIAYRVGAFGFLAHPELSRENGKSSGNYGILDMIAALQWVRHNIGQFGGDPQRVTIFGESAGAIAVSLLCTSPDAKGLFHRAISQSGGAFAPARFANEVGQNMPILKLAESIGKRFLDRLGAKDMKAARELSAERIRQGSGSSATAIFWPVADGNLLSEDAYEAYQERRFNDTPILIGTNSNEGAMFSSGSKPAVFEKHIRDGYGPTAGAILKVYPHATDAEAAQSSKDIFRDSAFAWHTWTWARLQLRMGTGKVFVYYFDHRTPFSPDGANHAAEIPYVFGNFSGPGGPPRKEDLSLSELLISYWTNFAKTGDPNSPGLPNWPAFAENQPNTLFFDGESGVRPLPNMEKLKALDIYYTWLRSQAKAKRAAR